ncbi:MAG: TIM44-like domain-containing protein [bacterium]
MTLRTWRALFGFAVTGAVILAGEMVFARAGGGGGFSGDGGGGFSGGGDGDGAGLIIYLLIRLVFEYPAVGIPLLIVTGVIFYHSSKGGYSAHVSYTIRRGLRVDATGRIEAGLESIQQRDPAFSVDAFLKRCHELLPCVQEAWSRQDMTPVRHFLSDGVFDRFFLQIEMQKGSGIRNEMRSLRVLGSRLAGSASDRFFDTLHVAITAEAVDTLVSLGDGRRLQGARTPESFTEIWTFLRRPGARTLDRPGLLDGCCPNCGTRLKLSTAIVCESCQALINSGEYDWVLSEITQQQAWSVPVSTEGEGVAELRQRDPGFNPQAIEDRVSALFWHHRAAEFFGSEEYLTAVALPTFIEKERESWRPDEAGRHLFYADAAVGSVDLAEVVPAGDRDDMDRVRVRVQWSGHRERKQVPGLLEPQWERSTLVQQEYVLVRKRGVQSVQAAALTSRHCPGCGAPQIAKQDGSCRYCGMRQNDGSTSWVLEAVSAFSGFSQLAVRPVTPEPLAGVLLSASDQEGMIRCVAAVMLADGVIDPEEDRQLISMAAKHNIPETRLKALMASVNKDDEVCLPQVDSWEQRAAFFKALVQMCLADGNVSTCERQVLRALVARMGFADVDVDMMISKVRAELYAASKGAIKAGRERRRA